MSKWMRFEVLLDHDGSPEAMEIVKEVSDAVALAAMAFDYSGPHTSEPHISAAFSEGTPEGYVDEIPPTEETTP